MSIERNVFPENWLTRSVEILFGETYQIVFTLCVVPSLLAIYVFIIQNENSIELKIVVFLEIISIILLLVFLSMLFSEYSTKKRIKEYLTKEVHFVMNELSSGSHSLKIEEILGKKNLFIPLNIVKDGDLSHNIYSIDILFEKVQNWDHENFLLLGNAGQGKTIGLTRLYKLLAEQFIEGKSEKIPILIPLRTAILNESVPFNEHKIYDFIISKSQLDNPFPISYSQFHNFLDNKKIFFLLDSFEEMPGDLNQDSINLRANHMIFHLPSILSCRNSFYYQYLSATEIKTSFLIKFKLQEIDFKTKPVRAYVIRFCKIKKYQNYNKVIRIIGNNKGLLDLSKNPLQLMMILDIFTNTPQNKIGNPEDIDWDIAQLYKLFTDNWLQTESGKIGSILDWHMKDALLEEIAWRSYFSQQPSHSSFSPYKHKLTRIDEQIIYDVIESQKPRLTKYNPSEIANELIHRSLLIVDKNGQFFFSHNNFRYFYIAKYAFECFKCNRNETKVILEISTPQETATFLRKMLKCKSLAENQKTAVTSNLIFAYESSMEDTPSSEIIREHAAYYLTCIGTKSAIEYAEKIIKTDPSCFVTRAIYVGLATNCNQIKKINEYVNILMKSPDEAEINLSYEMAYYGDKPLIKIHESNDNYEINHTLTAIFDHLQSTYQMNHWILDLFTLLHIVNKRGCDLVSINPDYLKFLQKFLKTEYSEFGPTFKEFQGKLYAFFAAQKCEGFEVPNNILIEKTEVISD